MDQGAAKVILHEFLSGVFDVFGAIAEAPFRFQPSGLNDADADAVASTAEFLPVVVRARLSDGETLALLLSVADVARILAISENADSPKDSLDEADLGTFQETANSAASAGVTKLVRALGEELAIDGVETLQIDPDDAGSLIESTGPATIVNLRFQSPPDFDSMAALLISHELEGRVPNDVVDSYADEDVGTGELVSDDEMQDILKGFGSPEAPEGGPEDLQGNLDVIMDIELLVTVRLGKVEMPLSEVLRLGPGSIIEVGQMVDDPVELLVNGKLVARGDVVVVDEKFGLRITEIVSRKERIESLR